LMMIAFRKKSSKCTNSRGPNMTAGLQLHMRDALLRGLQTVDNLLGNVLAVRTSQSVGTAAISVPKS
jgi:hypothetical protein